MVIENIRTMPEAWVAAAFSLTGAILIARKIIWGFAFHIMSNISWVAFALSRDILPLALIDAAYFFTNCYGIYRWYPSGYQAQGGAEHDSGISKALSD